MIERILDTDHGSTLIPRTRIWAEDGVGGNISSAAGWCWRLLELSALDDANYKECLEFTRRYLPPQSTEAIHCRWRKMLPHSSSLAAAEQQLMRQELQPARAGRGGAFVSNENLQ